MTDMSEFKNNRAMPLQKKIYIFESYSITLSHILNEYLKKHKYI